MNILEKFIRSQSKTNYQFAKLVGKKTPTIDAQIKKDRQNEENASITILLRYMKQFNIPEFSGTYNGKTVKIKIL